VWDLDTVLILVPSMAGRGKGAMLASEACAGRS